MKKKAYKPVILSFITIFTFALVLISCGATKESISISNDEKEAFEQVEGDTITISSDKTEYEIIIIEPGFYTWLNSIAKPEGYYSQSFLENRNYLMVLEWNRRVLQPMQYSPNLYELQIDYAQNIDYGYEVNYQLYNYFIYFQRKYNQRLGTFIPRI
jgi:signal peptidase I